jgi:hypothetical protein
MYAGFNGKFTYKKAGKKMKKQANLAYNLF